MDDRTEFGSLLHALETLGVSPKEVDSLMATIAGLLHLGELEFARLENGDADGCCLFASPVNDAHMHKAAELLGISADELVRPKSVDRRFA